MSPNEGGVETRVTIETPSTSNGEAPVVAELPPAAPSPPPTSSNKPSSKKTAYIIGGVVFVILVAVAITLAVVLTGNDDEGSASEISATTTEAAITPEGTAEPPTTQAPITEPPQSDPILLDFDGLITGLYNPRTFNATWISDGQLLYRTTDESYTIYNLATQQETSLLASVNQALTAGTTLQVSPDGSNILIASDVTSIYRHSFLARYANVELATGTLVNINPPGMNDALLQNVVWGPEGTSLAFVYENNVYYKSSVESVAVQITINGVADVVFNGIPDWVYEEEIFSSHSTLWLSATHMAYASFDDTNVRIMNYPIYGEPSSVDHQYTQHLALRYPKAGTTNPDATVTLRNVATGAFATFDAPTALDQAVLQQVVFASDDSILIIWSNRVQNLVEYHLCTLASCNVVYNNAFPSGWYIDSPVTFNNAGTSFIQIVPQLVGSQTWKHIVQVSQQTVGQAWVTQARTNAAYSVERILKWTDNDVIWFEATAVGDSAQQQLYSVASGTTQEVCFTCSLQGSDGQPCLYSDSTIDAGLTYVSVQCSGPSVPQTYILHINGTIETIWESNDQLSSLLSRASLPRVQRFSTQLHVGLDATDIAVQVPLGVENLTDVPLFVTVYGGPGSVSYRSRFWLELGTILVNRYNIVHAVIDGRGAGRRTVDNLFSVNRDLGTPEVDDQISAVSFLQSTLPYLSSNRTCIYGSSYGGYATTRALVRGGNVFKCGIAVAPVVDWHYYDTLYTERYMDVPIVNTNGYNESTLLTQETVEGLRSKSYFLIHGTADDNVHYQHSMLLSRVLQLGDVYFHQMTYTDEAHALSHVTPHLYSMMEKFLAEELDLVPNELN